MYRNGPLSKNYVPKWYVPKALCTDMDLPQDIQQLERVQHRAARFVKKRLSLYNSTQLNSTQLTTPKEEWINKRKEAKKLIYISPIL